MSFTDELTQGLATLTPHQEQGAPAKGRPRKRGAPTNGGVSVGGVQDRGGPLPGAWVTTDAVIGRVPLGLLVSALRQTGDDYSRLWLSADGALWVLNHTSSQSCASPACPACRFRKTVRHTPKR